MAANASNAIATGQATVAATAGGTLIAPARGDRKRLTIINGSTTDVFLGNSGVTTATGALLSGTKGQQIVLETCSAVYGIIGTGTEAVSYIEEFA